MKKECGIIKQAVKAGYTTEQAVEQAEQLQKFAALVVKDYRKRLNTKTDAYLQRRIETLLWKERSETWKSAAASCLQEQHQAAYNHYAMGFNFACHQLHQKFLGYAA